MIMPDRDDTNKSKWWLLGKRPDYRFSLANERTFLAWIRTSLALIAGAIAIYQYAHSLGTPELRLALVMVLLGVAAIIGGGAYRRWARSEIAMRHDKDLHISPLMAFLAIFVVGLAAALAALVVLG
jgi:putative membrane protein